MNESVREEESTDLVAKRKSSSVVWRYFGFTKEDVDQTDVLCRSCRKKVATKLGNTTNLFHHLEKSCTRRAKLKKPQRSQLHPPEPKTSKVGLTMHSPA